MRDAQGFWWSVIGFVGYIVIGLTLVSLATAYDARLFAPYTVVVIIMLAGIAWRSSNAMRRGDALETSLFSSPWKTFVTGSFRASVPAYSIGKLGRVVERGQLFDFVFLLWPFWMVFRWRTTSTDVSHHTGKIFTAPTTKTDMDKGEAGAARVMMSADPNLSISFLTIHRVVDVFLPQFYRRYVNLAAPRSVGTGDHAYDGTWLSHYLLISLQSLIAEAVRNAASQFTFDGTTEDDIVRQKARLELWILWILAEPGSKLRRAGILKRPTNGRGQDMAEEDFREKLKARHLAEAITFVHFHGEDVVDLDFNLEGLIFDRDFPNASEAEKAVNAAYVGLQEGRREGQKVREIGIARADTVKATQDKTKLDAATSAALQALEKTPTTAHVWGGGMKTLLKTILSK